MTMIEAHFLATNEATIELPADLPVIAVAGIRVVLHDGDKQPVSLAVSFTGRERICKNCRHWQRNAVGGPENHLYLGTCALHTSTFERNPATPPKFVLKYDEPPPPQDGVYIVKGCDSCYGGCIETGEDFGCIHFASGKGTNTNDR